MLSNSRYPLRSRRQEVLRSNRNAERDNLHVLQRDEYKSPKKKQKLSDEINKVVPKLVLSRVGKTDIYKSKLKISEENKKEYEKNDNEGTSANSNSEENLDFSNKPFKEEESNFSKIGKVYVCDVRKLVKNHLLKGFYDAFFEGIEIRSPENQVQAVRGQNNIIKTSINCNNEVKESDVPARNDYSEVGSSKIPVSLSGQQIWKWAGDSYKMRGVENKIFYKSICRGDETISIGDCVSFVSTGRPFISRIYSMWETSSKEMHVKGYWFYQPDELMFIDGLPYPEGALFQSNHKDSNNIQTIQHKCLVVPLEEYKTIIAKEYDNLRVAHNLFYIAGLYDPVTKRIYMMNNVIKVE